MVRGFYDIGSGIITQNKVIDTIANNIANSSTTGYKSQDTVVSSFDAMLTSRVGTGQYGDPSVTSLYDRTWIDVVSDTVTNYDQGAYQGTTRSLDFCITGPGFFQLKSNTGKICYSRNGSFNLDNEGYLCLVGAGRVQDASGSDIYLGTDKIVCSSTGELYDVDNGNFYGKIALFDFDDYKDLVEFNNTMYTTTAAPTISGAFIENQKLEASNVDLAKEITSAMRAQNLLQSQANILQMYADVLKDGTQRIAAIK